MFWALFLLLVLDGARGQSAACNSTAPNQKSAVYVQQEEALRTLYTALQGFTWWQSTNWLNQEVSFCCWFGVTCPPDGSYEVTGLSLFQNGLVGEVPAALGVFTNLSAINFRQNSISGVADVFGPLSKLGNLDLSYNALERLPSSIGSISGLEYLTLDNNLFREWPLGSGFEGLVFLSLTSNSIEAIPDSLCSLTNLTTLELGFNPFQSLPDCIGSMIELELLEIQNTLVASLPDLSGMQTLYTLNLAHTRIATLPSWVGKLGSLDILRLNDNSLESLPEELGDLGSSLTGLDVSNNKLQSISSSMLESLTGLQYLTLNGNKLKTFVLKGLPQLVGLYISENQLKDLEVSLPGLLELYANNNRLEKVSAEGCTQLRDIRVASNCLSSLAGIPLSIFDIIASDNRISLGDSPGPLHPNLYSVFLDQNNITSLSYFSQMPALTDLELGGNMINRVDESFCLSPNLKSLLYLRLAGNLLTDDSFSCQGTNLTGLELINLSDNRLETIPPFVTVQQHLNELYLARNKLRSVHAGSYLKGLSRLDLAENMLTKMPNLDSATSLENFAVNDNPLLSGPASIPTNQSLAYLNLGGCNFTDDVAIFSGLSKLQSLNISSQNFYGVFHLETLPALETLFMRENKVTDIVGKTADVHLFRIVVVDASYNQLRAVPDLAHFPIQELLLDGNDFGSRLPSDDDTFVWVPESLRVLSMSFCRMTVHLETLLASMNPNFPAIMRFVGNDISLNYTGCLSSRFIGGGLDLQGNALGHPIASSFLGHGSDYVSFTYYPNLSCQRPIMIASRQSFMVDPPFFNFTNCRCNKDFWGDPGMFPAQGCHLCGLEGSDLVELDCSKGGRLASFKTGGVFPVFYEEQFAGVVNCPSFWNSSLNVRWSPCNFGRNATLSYGAREIDTEAFCAPGYENRACSECAEGFYRGQLGSCYPCDPEPLKQWWVWTFIVLNGAFIVIFVFVKNPHVLLLYGEAGVFVILFFVAGGSNWVIGLLAIAVLVQLATQLKQYYIRRRVNDAVQRGQIEPQHRRQHEKQLLKENVMVSFSGFVKLLVFFIQTTGSLNATLWNTFEGVTKSFSAIKLKANGIECEQGLKWLVGKEWSKFLGSMALPWLVFLEILLLVVIRYFVQKGLDKCRAKSARRKELERIKKPLLDQEVDGNNINDLNDGRNESEDGNDDDEIMEPAGDEPAEEEGGMSAIVEVLLFILFLAYFDLAESIFAVFRRSFSETEHTFFMEEAPWVEAVWTNGDYQALAICAIIFLIVYVLGIPALFAYLLFRQSGPELELEFLKENYKAEYYYFELVWLLRRVLLAAALSLIPIESDYLPIAAVTIFAVFAGMQYVVRPFAYDLENLFDLSGVFVILITFVAALQMEEGVLGSSFQSSFYLVAVLNLIYILCLAVATAWPLLMYLRNRCCSKSKRGYFELDAVAGNDENELANARQEIERLKKEVDELRHSLNLK